MQRVLASFVLCAALIVVFVSASAHGDDAFELLGRELTEGVLPLVDRFCLDCHSSDSAKGDLDLERFANLAQVRRDPATWEKIIEMVGGGEMPPSRRPQPSPEERDRILRWARRYLDAEALASAGDPGRVAVRRLSNAEYTYTVEDLTGIDLEPAREFPADGAAGEGFTNAGDALAMSPALFSKYLGAAREIASHAVILPDGIRFSRGTTRRDWTDEILEEIRAIHREHADAEGRVDLDRYFSALIRHRDELSGDLDRVEEIARDEKIGATYLEILARMLVSGEPRSLLLDRVRSLWRAARIEDASLIAAVIRSWQDKLWSYRPVGHFGLVRPWQSSVDITLTSTELRARCEPSERDGEDVVFRLVARAAARETSRAEPSGADFVVWERPRFERSDRQPLLLRDLRPAAVALTAARKEALGRAPQYLDAIYDACDAKRELGREEISALASMSGLDPAILLAWVDYLGVASGPSGREPRIEKYLDGPVRNVAGSEWIRAWVVPGIADLSVASNASDGLARIPGALRPHRVAVHPRPERWIAAGWRSPITGAVHLASRAEDVHGECGNGISWSLELWRGSRRRVFRAGDVDRGASTPEVQIESVPIREGDLVALIISARDGDHTCDLTQIDLAIRELAGEERTWSLADDCASDLLAGNPHADRFGNERAWHFFTGSMEDRAETRDIPPGSFLDRWLDALDARDRAAATELAAKFSSFLDDSPENAPQADTELREKIHSLGGPLLSRVDLGTFRASAPAVVGAAKEDGGSTAGGPGADSSRYGLDPEAFGQRAGGPEVSSDSLLVPVPSTIVIRAPREIVEGSDLVVRGRLAASSTRGGPVQLFLECGAQATRDPASLVPGAPLVVAPGSAGEKLAHQAIEDFNDYFPRALFYPPIVPVDEVVTLVLFHREDEHLRRLMLDDAERDRLDRLWDELHYVSQDALTIVTGFEQLMEFATQDSDPKLFEPLRTPILERAAEFRRLLAETEPRHVEALLEIASRAYRRPLARDEAKGLRDLYGLLRTEGSTHEEAVRLVLARILASPAFLYRLEDRPPGTAPAPVSDWELATRLSYFLSSSMPDAELREEAARGHLHDPAVLVREVRRLLRDSRVRRLAVEFGCQWLHIRGFDEFDEKSERHFPEFAALRSSMYEEAVLFFTDLFQRDGRVLDLLDADYAFVDAPLASFYGLPLVEGSTWRRAEGVEELSRGGILGMAAVLARQAGASRTSPVLRGAFISETLLGEKLPRPPPGVPVLPEVAPEGLTERQLVEKHASDPACAKCHERIDPWGFALEGFNAIGRRREVDARGFPIDTRTTLPGGIAVEGLDGLRRVLVTEKRDVFLRQVSRKLLGYALGRAVTLSDRPLLDGIIALSDERDLRWSDLIETIVRSPQFQEIRGRDATGAVDRR